MNELTGAVALAQVRKIDAVLERTRRAQRIILEGLRQAIGGASHEGDAGDAGAPFTLRTVPDPAGDAGIAVGLRFDAPQTSRRLPRRRCAPRAFPSLPCTVGARCTSCPSCKTLAARCGRTARLCAPGGPRRATGGLSANGSPVLAAHAGVVRHAGLQRRGRRRRRTSGTQGVAGLRRRPT